MKQNLHCPPYRRLTIMPRMIVDGFAATARFEEIS
jgi:hypothetical protein